MGLEDPIKRSGPRSTNEKRKRVDNNAPITLSGNVDNPTRKKIDRNASQDDRKAKKSSRKEAAEEKRLRRFRKSPPQSYLEKLERATTQRQEV